MEAVLWIARVCALSAGKAFDAAMREGAEAVRRLANRTRDMSHPAFKSALYDFLDGLLVGRISAPYRGVVLPRDGMVVRSAACGMNSNRKPVDLAQRASSRKGGVVEASGGKGAILDLTGGRKA